MLNPARSEFLAAGLILVLTLLLFWFSPVSQVTDSHYSMLLSESLLRHKSFALDHFAVPRLEPQSGTRDNYVMDGSIWQLELANAHIYYYFPPGSSILSAPFVAIANLFGVSAVNADGTYNQRNETRIERALAAILMAALAVIFFFTARLRLPLGWSVIVALAGALGTQVWSTASRALWSHTWEMLLVGIVVLLLLKSEIRKNRLNPILLSSLLAWIYFVRPSGSVVIVATSIYVLLYQRRILNPYVITGAVWLAGFMVYSWYHFGRLLPSYYRASRLRFDLFPVAFAGNLLSPSRGLLIYVPMIFFVAYLLLRFWKYVATPRLAVLALTIILGHLLVISCFANWWGDWWGGASYGPRYTADLVPWLVLLGILGLSAILRSREQGGKISAFRWQVQLATGAVLLALSVLINARGAISQDTWKWTQPATDKQMRALLWDWKHPQFLAGLQSPPAPTDVPLIHSGTRIDFGSPDADRYLWYGWSGPEQAAFRWSEGNEAAVMFALDQASDILVKIRVVPFLEADKLPIQTVTFRLNGKHLDTFALRESSATTISTTLRRSFLSRENVLTFELPNAASPSSLKISEDNRVLGIQVEWMEFDVDSESKSRWGDKGNVGTGATR